MRAENVTKQKACVDLQQFEIFDKKLSFNLQCFSVRQFWMLHIEITGFDTIRYKLHHLKSSYVLPVKIQAVKVT